MFPLGSDAFVKVGLTGALLAEGNMVARRLWTPDGEGGEAGAISHRMAPAVRLLWGDDDGRQAGLQGDGLERGAGGGADLGHCARGDVDRVGREAPGKPGRGFRFALLQVWPSALLQPWPVVLGAGRRMVTRGCSLSGAYRVVSAVCEGVQRDAP